MKTLQKTFLWLFLAVTAAAVLWLAGGLSLAQPPGKGTSVKIGFVDFQKILDESVVGKKAQEELEKKFGSTKELLKKKRQELQELQNQIEKQKDVLSALALEEKKNLFAVKYNNYMKQKMMLQEQYNNEFVQLVKPMQKEITDIINAIGKEKSFTIIFKYDESAQTGDSKLAEFLFFPSAIAYFDGGVNISAEVLKRYDAKHR